jgi:hypothetical protein
LFEGGKALGGALDTAETGLDILFRLCYHPYMMLMTTEQTISESLRNVMGGGVHDALQALAESQARLDKDVRDAALVVADVFDDAKKFERILAGDSAERRRAEQKLISAFQNNLNLLIEKTWVEKSDEALKVQVLYRLTRFCTEIAQGRYAPSGLVFMDIVKDTVYLMFGPQSQKHDFDEYAMRIDPDFGIFWQYIRALERSLASPAQGDETCRTLLLLGMFFIANY